MMATASETELSDLSTEFEEDGLIVRVEIFRPAGSHDGWALQVISPKKDVTMWEESFPTEYEAWMEFLETIERLGIEYFLTQDGADTLH